MSVDLFILQRNLVLQLPQISYLQCNELITLHSQKYKE